MQKSKNSVNDNLEVDHTETFKLYVAFYIRKCYKTPILKRAKPCQHANQKEYGYYIEYNLNLKKISTRWYKLFQKQKTGWLCLRSYVFKQNEK